MHTELGSWDSRHPTSAQFARWACHRTALGCLVHRSLEALLALPQVCDLVLSDKTVPKDTRRRRAEALRDLATIFQVRHGHVSLIHSSDIITQQSLLLLDVCLLCPSCTA